MTYRPSPATPAPPTDTSVVDQIVPGVAAFVDVLGADILSAEDIGAWAAQYAALGYAVFPLRGKIPAIGGGRGVLDATTDLAQVCAWWDGPYRGANIGLRVPEGAIVVDIDPRNGGDATVAAWRTEHGLLPATLTAFSGRGDGGMHLYFRAPVGRLRGTAGPGVDIKTARGYVVAPPSLHPDTGRPYMWVNIAPVAAPPAWLLEKIVVPEPEPAPTVRVVPPAAPSAGRPVIGSTDSIADAFVAATTWTQVLAPHGWRRVRGDGDSDGSGWLHPAATSSLSATVTNQCLFVYSPNTPFNVTEASNPNGYTRFKAWSVLRHGGDMSAAARAFKATGEV